MNVFEKKSYVINRIIKKRLTKFCLIITRVPGTLAYFFYRLFYIQIDTWYKLRNAATAIIAQKLSTRGKTVIHSHFQTFILGPLSPLLMRRSTLIVTSLDSIRNTQMQFRSESSEGFSLIAVRDCYCWDVCRLLSGFIQLSINRTVTVVDDGRSFSRSVFYMHNGLNSTMGGFNRISKRGLSAARCLLLMCLMTIGRLFEEFV